MTVNQIQLSPKTETSNRTIDIDKSTLNLLSKWQLEIKKEVPQIWKT